MLVRTASGSLRDSANLFVELQELSGEQTAQQHGGHLARFLRLLAILDVSQ